MKKKPAAVAAAEETLHAKAAELAAAKDAVVRLGQEHCACVQALRAAQTEADSDLPQCDLVSVGFRSDKETPVCRVVILRKTPGGMLVTRHVGAADGYEQRFKWSAHRGKYVQAEKQGAWVSDHRELRGVPADYLPADGRHNVRAKPAPTAPQEQR